MKGYSLKEGGVGHAWVRLDDGTIIDGASGQFMGERSMGGRGRIRSPSVKHRNRLRIIPPNSKLQQYYEVDPDDVGEYVYDDIFKAKQRLAYTGGTKYDEQLTNLQKDFEGMRDEVLTKRHGTDKGMLSLPSHNEFGNLCTDEATCGATSSVLFKKLGLDRGKSNVGFKNVKIEGGIYSGPGTEFSGAAVDTTDYKKRKSGEPLSAEVGHEWIKLEDGTIVDGSAGQFMNQDVGFDEAGRYKGREHRQNQRLRVIRPNDPLYKHYKGKYERDRVSGKQKWYNPKDPLKKLNVAGSGFYSLDKSARIQKAKQRLAVIPGLWDEEPGSHISVPEVAPKPMWNRKQLKRHYDASGPIKTKLRHKDVSTEDTIKVKTDREAAGADKAIDDYFTINPQGEKLTRSYKKLEGINNKKLRKIPARRVVHNPSPGDLSKSVEDIMGLTKEGTPYRTLPSERFAPEPKEGTIEDFEQNYLNLEPPLSFDESIKRFPRPKNVIFRSVAEHHAKSTRIQMARQRLGVISPIYKNYRRNRKKPVAEERVIPKDKFPTMTDLQKKLHKRQMGDADPETGVPYPLDFHEEPMYITQENATSYAKLRQRIAVIRVSPATKRVERVKKVLDYDYPYQGPEKYSPPFIKGSNRRQQTWTQTGENRRRKVTKQEEKSLQKYISKGTKIKPKKPTRKQFRKVIQAKKRKRNV